MNAYEHYRGFALVPPGKRKGNKSWIVRGLCRGEMLEAATRKASAVEAKQFIDALLGRIVRLEESVYRINAGDALPGWVRKMRQAAAGRSSKSGVPFTLTNADMLDLVTRANGACEVTGTPFSNRHIGANKRRPWVPSLDRIIPERGYTPQNCRLVLFAINVAMSDWGESVLMDAVGISVGKNNNQVIDI